MRVRINILSYSRLIIVLYVGWGASLLSEDELSGIPGMVWKNDGSWYGGEGFGVEGSLDS